MWNYLLFCTSLVLLGERSEDKTFNATEVAGGKSVDGGAGDADMSVMESCVMVEFRGALDENERAWEEGNVGFLLNVVVSSS